MQLPFFYIENYSPGQKEVILSEETSRHVVQVLRMETGELLKLTDGLGTLLTGFISLAHKKHCAVTIQSAEQHPPAARQVAIGISLLKNTNRFEWFLEKATELGISEIIPLLCERTEKQKFRQDRMTGICVSAMLQSQQTWLPLLHEPVQFEKLIDESDRLSFDLKLIAHCLEDPQKADLSVPGREKRSTLVLIGPEGDFSGAEIRQAYQKGFQPVSLGNTRLRTETAGVTAAVLLAWSNG